MNKDYSIQIAQELRLRTEQVQNTLELLASSATVPFISRYRKEATDSLDEVAIANIRDRNLQLVELDKRRESIIESIKEQGTLTDELERQLYDAKTLSLLEDIYLPYRPKKKTRATVAKAKGLEPLAKMLMAQNNFNVNERAAGFLNDEVKSVEEALSGARDIIAEWISENSLSRGRIRNLFEREAKIFSKIIKGKESEGVNFKNYFEFEEPLMRSPSHRILAMFRGEQESFLKIKILPSEEKAIEILEKIFSKADNDAAEQVRKAIKDSYKRLLTSSMETEMRQMVKEKADAKAIEIFSENLRQLLLAPPLGQKNVLAIDPGFRTGCKIVCLDKQGKLLYNQTIYPHPPVNKVKEAANKIESLVEAYEIEAIAIGNGTGGRETEFFIKKLRFKKDIMALMVNESGASVYSASSVAREEFPEYDVTVRGAVSIGRRLTDPLAELVKIDPKSIGVGQYQHDVDQNALQKKLEEVVISCVNLVGIELNTASKQLLTYVSGVGPALAENIIQYRNKNGAFRSREELKKVSRFGDKAFEQAAGFIRVRNSGNPLDNSAVHPESYYVVEQMSKDLNCTIEELIKRPELQQKIELKNYISERIGLPTLNDIMKELAKPGRDPREEIEMFTFDRTIHKPEDLVIGKRYPGIVTNITAFGAFVDIGVHQDGLVHVSQLADGFISDPNDVVRINQKVIVKVISVDAERKRIGLSLKSE